MNSVTDAKASYSTGQDGLSISSVMSGKDVQIRLSRAKRDNLTECKLSAPLNLTAYIDPSAS